MQGLEFVYIMAGLGFLNPRGAHVREPPAIVQQKGFYASDIRVEQMRAKQHMDTKV